MVGIEPPGEDRLPPGPRRDLVLALHDLYRGAGRPGLRRIASEIGRTHEYPDTVSHETAGAILRGEGIPRWTKLECLVRQLSVWHRPRLDADEEAARFLGLWNAASGPTIVSSDDPDGAISVHAYVPVEASTVKRPPHPVKADGPDVVLTAPKPAIPITTNTHSGLASPVGGPARGSSFLWRNVPPRNPNFTGREEILLALCNEFRVGIAALLPVSLHGMGGVGKTQIAIEYVHRFATDYDLICWISGEVPMQFRADLAALAPDLGIPAVGDLEIRLVAVCDALLRGDPYPRWLLVVDDADAPDDLLRYLPITGGHLLITSRNSTWVASAHAFHVFEFTREESIALILRRGRDISVEDANLLAERLGDLPLAIEQAAAWQAETGMSVRRYLALLDQQMSTMLAENPPPSHPVSIAAAWVLAFEDLQRQSPESAALLQLCAFLGPEPIPYMLLWAFRHSPAAPPELQRLFSDEFVFYRAVRQAGRAALLKVDANRETLTVHRLVQAVLRERLSAEQRTEMTALVRRLLETANPGRPDDPLNWELLAAINRHLQPSGIIDSDNNAARTVIIDQIRFLYNRGDHASSRELADEAVLQWRKSPGPDHQQTLIACRLLALVKRELGLLEQARQLSEDTLTRTRRVFGDTHEYTLVAANNYAGDLRMTGDYTTALELDQTLYAQHKEIFGEYGEETLQSGHNLATDLRLINHYSEAYRLDLDILQRRREMLGDERWDTWSSAVAVGMDLRGLGEFAEAERFLEEAVPHISVLLGPDHPAVVRANMEHAAILRQLGRFAEALATAEACTDLNLRRLGERHNQTLSAMTTLAELLRLTGSVDHALDIAERVVAAAPATYGEHHLLVALCQHNYAIKLRAVGNHHSAAAIDRDVNQRLHERGHQTVCTDTSLARDVELAGDTVTARRLLQQVAQTSVRLSGQRHPRSLFCAANLARLGNDAKAAAAPLSTLAETLGPQHPEVEQAAAGEFIEFEIEIPGT